jgi:hypothetical protein
LGINLALFGEVFLYQNTCSSKGWCGGLVMEKVFRFGRISGYLVLYPIRYNPHNVSLELSRVKALIDPEVCAWRVSLIQEIFNAEEAKVIVNIPLSPTLPPDKLIWNGTLDGVFLVRSAYHMRMEFQAHSQGSTSSAEKGQQIWKAIWNLKVQNPLKIFLWRACHNLLPTKVNLCIRKVVEDNLCPCCTRKVESVIHALWCCLAAQDV